MKTDHRIPLYLLPFDLRPEFILNRPKVHDLLHRTVCKIAAISQSTGTVTPPTSMSTFVMAILDGITHLTVSGATVRVMDLSTHSTGIGVSNSQGVVAITLNSSQNITAAVSVDAVGYSPYSNTLVLNAQVSTTINLTPTVPGGSPGNDMPTYIVSQANPTARYKYTSLQVVQRLVSGSGGGHKNYGFFAIDVTQPTSPVPPGSTTISTLSGFNTNNIYWNIASSSGFRYGTVGVDADIDPVDGNTTINQYVNPPNGVNVAVGTKAHCNPQPSVHPPCFIDSGGEYRNSVYMFVTDPTRTKAYQIVGGSIIKQSDGSFAAVVVINAGTSGGLGTNTCGCPAVTTIGYEVDWAARAPPPNNTVPGNYQIFPTIGGTITRAGTGALVINQEINPSGSTGGGGGGGGTGTIGSVVFTSPVPVNNTAIQTATVKDNNGAPLQGVTIVFLENAGTGGGYAHGTTNLEGLFQITNHFPGTGTYTDWAQATLGTQVVESNKVTTII